MKLSIVVVSWNMEVLLKDCLASIFAYPPECGFDVWVVDNASSDGSVAMMKRCFPQVHLIESKTNLGFAQGNNVAVENIRSELVLLLNSDTVLMSGALTVWVDFMDARPEAGAAGSMLLNPNESLQPSCYPSPKRELWRLLHLDWLYPIGRYQVKRDTIPNWTPSMLTYTEWFNPSFPALLGGGYI